MPKRRAGNAPDRHAAPARRPRDILIYVVYRDEAAWIAHRDGPIRARHGKEAEGILLGATGTRCKVLG